MESTQNKIYEIEDQDYDPNHTKEKLEGDDNRPQKNEKLEEDMFNYGDQFEETIQNKDEKEDEQKGQVMEPKLVSTSK